MTRGEVFYGFLLTVIIVAMLALSVSPPAFCDKTDASSAGDSSDRNVAKLLQARPADKNVASGLQPACEHWIVSRQLVSTRGGAALVPELPDSWEPFAAFPASLDSWSILLRRCR